MAVVNGELIRVARLRRGLTQHQVCALIAERGLKYDNSSLSKVEQGKLGLAAPMVPVISDVLGVPVDDLIAEADGDAA
jgi:transcriptional regulator with XRE-family HTH domain